MDAPLGIPHIAFDVAGFQIHHQCRTTQTVIVLNRLNRFQSLEFDELAERDKSSIADAHRQLLDLLIVGAQFLRHSHDDVVSFAAADDRADDLPSKRRIDGFVHFARLQSVTLEHFALRVDLELRCAAFRLVFHLCRARRLL